MGRGLGFLEGLGWIGLNWAGDQSYVSLFGFFSFIFLFSTRVSDGGWLVGWANVGVCCLSQWRGGFPWVVWGLC